MCCPGRMRQKQIENQINSMDILWIYGNVFLNHKRIELILTFFKGKTILHPCLSNYKFCSSPVNKIPHSMLVSPTKNHICQKRNRLETHKLHIFFGYFIWIAWASFDAHPISTFWIFLFFSVDDFDCRILFFFFCLGCAKFGSCHWFVRIVFCLFIIWISQYVFITIKCFNSSAKKRAKFGFNFLAFHWSITWYARLKWRKIEREWNVHSISTWTWKTVVFLYSVGYFTSSFV